MATRLVAASAAALLVMVLAHPAGAIIRIDMPLSKMGSVSDQTVVAEVSRADGAAALVELKVLDAAVSKRSAPSAVPLQGAVRLRAEPPADWIKRIAPKDPAVIFVGLKGSLVHIADTWFQAAQPEPGVFAVSGAFERPYCFPGRTRALVRILRQIREHPDTPAWGRDTVSASELAKYGWPLLDLFEHSNFTERHPLGDLGVSPRFMVAADVSGDRKCDLLVLAADGAHFYLGTAPVSPFQEATAAWGLAGIKPAAAAFGDVNGDGKPDLLADGLWINTGSRFTSAKVAVDLSDAPDVLAVAIADVSTDGNPDALALLKDGRLLVFENPGRTDVRWTARPARVLWQRGDPPLAAHFGDWGDTGKLHVMVIRASGLLRYALDDDGGPPADYARLTGQPAGTGKGGFTWTFTDYTASAAIDLNGGDGRIDLVIDTRRGKGCDAVLINRGYGALWRNNEGTVDHGKERSAPAAMTAADMDGDGSQELLIADANGKLVRVDSPPFKRGKPKEK